MLPLSVIIPIGPGEKAYVNLLKNFESLGKKVPISGFCEFILVATEKIDVSWSGLCPLRVMATSPGRGRQLNEGASWARGKFLWFLHADTEVRAGSFKKLQDSLRNYPNDIHYFNLKFNSRKMILNEWGVSFRSRVLGMPFGDQGFALKKSLLEQLGGFPEIPAEDHHFIWQARLQGLKLRNIGDFLVTSDRKYQEHGWLRVTCNHLFLTFKQAIPYWRKFLSG